MGDREGGHSSWFIKKMRQEVREAGGDQGGGTEDVKEGSGSLPRHALSKDNGQAFLNTTGLSRGRTLG